MGLAPGSRIGPYVVQALLGSGGMGEVYRARDDRLRRFVALKVLPLDVAAQPESHRRLIAEARAAAALDHPFICKIHEVGEADGRSFIAMECVSGVTLRERLAGGALLLRQGLSLAIETAEALVTAHEAGVLHRDLKPSNLMMAVDGHVKVLDFGLATRIVAADMNESTETSPGAESTSVRGTLGYMSPEQLRQQPSDARSDVFAFGIVLYELFAGRHPFSRGTAFETVAAILREDPEWPVHLDLPPLLQHIIRKALAKAPADRYQSMREVLTDLRAAQADTDHVSREPTERQAARRPRLAPAVVVGLIAVPSALAAVAMYWSMTGRDAGTRPAPVHKQITFLGNVLGAATSPDGATVAYITDNLDGSRQIFVQDPRGGAPIVVTNGARPIFLKWSADGTRLAYSGTGPDGRIGVFVQPRFGGEPKLIVEAPLLNTPFAWSPDGTLIAAAPRVGRLTIVNTSTGDSSQQIDLASIKGFVHDLDWNSRTGRLAVLVMATVGGLPPSDLWSVALDGTQPIHITNDKAFLRSPVWSTDGRSIYCLRVANDVSDLLKLDGRQSGTPTVLMSGLADDLGSRISLADGGKRLVHLPRLSSMNLWSVEPARPQTTLRPITRGTKKYDRVRVSADGRWILAVEGYTGGRRIVKVAVDGGEPIPLTTDADRATAPDWSPDASSVLFTAPRDNQLAAWVMQPDGRDRRPLDLIGPDTVWLHDGRLARAHGDGENRHYTLRDMTTGQETPVADKQSGGAMGFPVLSPDGNELALYWTRRVTGLPTGLWVVTLKNKAERLLGERLRPLGWSPDGANLYAISVGPTTSKVFIVPARGGALQTLINVPGWANDGHLTRDGRLLVFTVYEMRSDAWAIEHFDR